MPGLEQLLSQNLQFLCIKGGVDGAIHPSTELLSDTQANRFFHHTITYVNDPIMQSKAELFQWKRKSRYVSPPNPATAG